MLRAFSLAFFATFFASKSLAQTPKSQPVRSLLWEISGPAAARPSYLYGTMHVPEKLAFHLSDSFFVALKSADVVALETDPGTWQPFFQEIAGVEMGQKTGAIREISPFEGEQDFYNFTFWVQPPTNQMLGGLLSAQPSMANQLLFRTGEMNQDFEEDTYLDMFIYQAGRKLRKPVVGLEMTDESYEMAMRSSIPDDPDEAENEGFSGGFGDFSAIQEAYRAQDIDRIDSLSRKTTPSRNHQKWLIDERNAVMCRRLDSLMRGGQTVFAGVGAAHLAGPLGMIPMMRQKGWAMRPVLFLAHAESKTKQEIDDLRLPVALEKRFSKDSAWSALAPAPFFPANPAMGDDFEMLSTDLANGAFYAVFRAKTFGGLVGQGAEKMAARLDSLIYENVPGKISERKRLRIDGLEMFEITTRTRRGDAQRYRIFVTPEEIFMFVAGGNGDWAMGKDAAAFLESANLNERLFSKKAANWPLFEPKKGGFAVVWPLMPLGDEPRIGPTGAFSMTATDPEDGSFYLVAREFLPDFGYIEEDSFELNFLTEKVADRAGFRIAERSFSTEKGATATDVLLRKKDDSTVVAHARLVIDGADFWLLLARPGDEKGTRNDRFFNSFERREWAYADFETVEDTVGNFKISLPKGSKKPSAIALRLEAIQKEIVEKSAGLYNDFGAAGLGEDADEFVPKSFFAECAATGERIILNHEKLPPTAAFPDQDSLERFCAEKLDPARSLHFSLKKWRKMPNSDLLTGEFELTDTGSVRGIWAKILVRDREIWQIRATSRGPGQPNSKFVAAAFQTFSPLGEPTGESLLGERDLSFLEEIFSEDSLLAASALRKLPFLRPEKGDFDRLAPLVERPDFSKLAMRDREQILEAISRTEPERARPFFENFYKKWPDTATYQVAALHGLVALQTAASHDAFLKLLDEEPPFLSPATLEAIFYAFRDSLPLARRLFPKLLGWAAYPEFEAAVLDLLGDLTDAGEVKPKMYASKKADFLRNGRRAFAQLRYASERAAQAGANGNPAFEGGYGDGDQWGAGTQLLRFARLLAPFYKKDAAVAAFFEKLRRAGDSDFRLQLFSLFFDQNLSVSNDDLRPIAEDRKQTHRLFSLLKAKNQLAGRTGFFTGGSEGMARSFLESTTSFGYPPEKWDTIRLLARHEIAAKKERGSLFFFEMKPEKQKATRLGYVFLPEKSSWTLANDPWAEQLDFNRQPQSRLIQEYEEQGKSHDEIMRTKLASYRFSGRQRVRTDWSSGPQF